MADFDDLFNDPPEEDQLSMEAEDLMRQGRYQDAVSRYDTLRHRQPADLWAKLGYASALECNGQIREAEAVIEEVRSSNAANRHAQRFCVLFYERREDKLRARHCIEHLHQHETGYDDAPIDQLAELYFNQGRYHEAEAELQRILREEVPEDNQQRASVLARVGACERQSNELDEARDSLRQAIELDPHNHWILSELAETERALGEYTSARRYYEEALQLEDEDAWSRGRLANLEFEEGHTERAILLYQQILTQDPRAVWARVELAQVFGEDDPEQSRRLCEQALEQDPTYPWAYAQLAMLARYDNRPDDAHRHFQQALKHSPQSLWLLHELADVCRQMGRNEEARAHLEHAHAMAPFDATTHGFMADLLRSEGRNQEALAYLTKAVELDPNYTWAWRELCELHAIAGNHDQAERDYETVVQLEPDEAINDGLKAFLLRFQDQRDAAVPYLESALAKYPEYFWAWRELADYFLSQGLFARAEQVCRRALDHLGESLLMLTMLCEAQRQQHKRLDALDSARRGLQVDSHNAQLWALRAELVLPDNRAEALQAAYKANDFSDAAEYRVLLVQCLIVCGKAEQARRLLDPLCGDDAVSPVPFELAAEFAEQDGETERAIALCDEGLRLFPGTVRLIIRRTRLGLDAREPEALVRLVPLLDHEDSLPWHEITPLFARGGDMPSVRRAAYRHINQCGGDSENAARAWLVLAESLLLNGQQTEAREALRTSLALKGDLVPARLLAAMLADQENDYERALEHLGAVRELLEADGDGDRQPLERAALLQQIAHLHERAGNFPTAEETWDLISTIPGISDELRLEQHSFQLRMGQETAADTGLRALSEDVQLDNEIAQRALHQLALADINRQEPQQALTRLLEHRPVLNPANRLLAAQCALLVGDLERSASLLDALEPADTAQAELAARLRARLLLAQPDQRQAGLARARELHERKPAHEANACLYAEALMLDGDIPTALSVLRNPALSDRPSGERVLLVSCLLLERDDEPAAFAYLGRHRQSFQGDNALLRVLGAAWPSLLGQHNGDPPDIDDLTSLPPLLTCNQHIAGALCKQGHHALVAGLWIGLANRFLLFHQPYSAHIAWRRAVLPLLRCGQRRQALHAARRGRSLALWLRCCVPV